MVADARCPSCGGVKRPNGTTRGEPWCRCAPPPAPADRDYPRGGEVRVSFTRLELRLAGFVGMLFGIGIGLFLAATF